MPAVAWQESPCILLHSLVQAELSGGQNHYIYVLIRQKKVIHVYKNFGRHQLSRVSFTTFYHYRLFLQPSYYTYLQTHM
jgi:hypothetical protein